MTQEIQIPPPELIETCKLSVHKTHKNPNSMTREQLDRLKTSIKKYGFLVPIITNKDLVIADGEQRWIIANELAMPQVLVVRVPLEEVDRLLIQQIMNSSAVRGVHDLLLDAMSFENIIELGKEDDLKYLLDLDANDLERYMLALHEPQEEEKETPPLEGIETDIVVGDIFQLGTHRLMCGDSTSEQDVNTLMNGHKADLIYTDPPYGVDYEGGTTKRGKLKGDSTTAIYDQTLALFPSITKSYTPVYLWHSDSHAKDVLIALNKYGFEPRALIVWNKNIAQYGALSAQYKQKHEPMFYAVKRGEKPAWYGPTNEVTVWEEKRAQENKYHPTEKPVTLAVRVMHNSSKPQDIVLDLFGGSGATMIAAEFANRTCYMMELDPRYIEVICRRWEAYTSQKRVKLN
jgi:DNA modification methylase